MAIMQKYDKQVHGIPQNSCCDIIASNMMQGHTLNVQTGNTLGYAVFHNTLLHVLCVNEGKGVPKSQKRGTTRNN